MARIVTGALTTFNLSTHLDPQTVDLYGVADYFSTPGYTGATPKMYLNGSGFWGLGLASSPAALLHAKDSNAEVGRVETTNATGGFVSSYTSGVIQGLLGWGTNVFAANAFGLRSGSGIPINLAMGGAIPQLKIDTSGNVVTALQSGAPTLATNLDMAFQLVSNTSLKVLVRGSDGTTRSATLTLA